MKKLICVLLAAVLILALTACGGAPQETTQATTLPPETALPPETTQPPLTAKGVAEQLVQAMKGKTMTGFAMAINFDFTLIQPAADENAEAEEVSMQMSLKMDMKISPDPMAAYMDTYVSMKMDTMDFGYGMETYMVTEDGQLVTYLYMPMKESWTRTVALAEDAQDLTKETDVTWLLEKPEQELTLEEEIQTLNGREVYVLKCTLSGQEMQKTVDSTAAMGDSLSSMGLSAEDFATLQVPTVYYIDAHTFQLVQQQIQMEGMEELMNSVLSNSLGADAATLGVEVKIKEMNLSMTDITYDPVEVPAVPQEAYDAIANAATYRLEEAGKAVQVVCPSGWTESAAETDVLAIVKDDETQEALFVMFADVSDYDFEKIIEDGDVADLKDMGIYKSHKKGEPIGTYETMELIGEGISVYYAWGPVGDAYIYVHIVDYAGQTLEEALTPLLNAVSIPAAE